MRYDALTPPPLRHAPPTAHFFHLPPTPSPPERMEADEGREDWSDYSVKTWIMSVIEMVTVKALKMVTVKARIRMVWYCLNAAVRFVVIG